MATSPERDGQVESIVPAAGEGRLREHLVLHRLAGFVATPWESTLENCAKLSRGEPVYTFGMSDWRISSAADAEAAVARYCGTAPASEEATGPGWIDPDSTVRAIEHQRDRIEHISSLGRAKVILATGHPQGLLAHYIRIAAHLAASGCRLLTPLDDQLVTTDEGDRPRGIRFINGVACVFDGGGLRHSHASVYMEAMLDALGGEAPDLVIADHGMAGAAIEAGIETLSIADVNDPALLLAQARSRTEGVMPIDDNLAPFLFAPVTAAILGETPWRRPFPST